MIERFPWCEDFAACRNHADSLASGDWLLFLDLDDRIVNAGALRREVARAPASARMLALSWDYKTVPSGKMLRLWSERLWRRESAPPWQDRLHPYRLVGPAERVLIPRHVCSVVHDDPDGGDSPAKHRRNLRVAQNWLADEPDCLRAMARVVEELRCNGKMAELVPIARRFLRRCRLPPKDDPEYGVWLSFVENTRFALALALIFDLDDLRGARRLIDRWCADEFETPLPYAMLAVLEAKRQRWDTAMAAAVTADRLRADAGDDFHALCRLPMELPIVSHPLRMLLRAARRSRLPLGGALDCS